MSQPKLRILSLMDEQRLQEQAQLIQQHLLMLDASAHLEKSPADLQLLQRILDEGVFQPDQKYQLQSLGVAFGNVLAQVHGLHWVIVEDQHGRDPALRYKDTPLLVYPLTLISKRVEQGESVDLKALFAQLGKGLERAIAGL